MPRRKCCVCCEREAAVPDRNRAPSMILRVCRECHAGRLRGDLRHVLDVEAKRRQAADAVDPVASDGVGTSTREKVFGKVITQQEGEA